MAAAATAPPAVAAPWTPHGSSRAQNMAPHILWGPHSLSWTEGFLITQAARCGARGLACQVSQSLKLLLRVFLEALPWTPAALPGRSASGPR